MGFLVISFVCTRQGAKIFLPQRSSAKEQKVREMMFEPLICNMDIVEKIGSNY